MAILPEPTWGEPTKSYGEQSALCITRPAPHVVTGLILQLLRAHFSDPDNIVDPKLKGFIWTDDDTTGHTINSKVKIEPSYKFDAATVEQRPSILVRRGEFISNEFALTNGSAAYMSDNGNYEGKVKQVKLTGQHSIEVCGHSAMEADRLSEEVFFRMLEYKSVIEQDLKFSHFEVKVLKGLQKIEEGNEHWKASIDIRWAFIYSWRVVALAPILKKVGQIFNIE